jgi:ribosomal protein L23
MWLGRIFWVGWSSNACAAPRLPTMQIGRRSQIPSPCSGGPCPPALWRVLSFALRVCRCAAGECAPGAGAWGARGAGRAASTPNHRRGRRSPHPAAAMAGRPTYFPQMSLTLVRRVTASLPHNTYMFRASPSVTKAEVAEYLSKVHGVTPARVTTSIHLGERRDGEGRRGTGTGLRGCPSLGLRGKALLLTSFSAPPPAPGATPVLPPRLLARRRQDPPCRGQAPEVRQAAGLQARPRPRRQRPGRPRIHPRGAAAHSGAAPGALRRAGDG